MISQMNENTLLHSVDFYNGIDDVEGIEFDEIYSEGWGDYPLDANFVRTSYKSVREVVDRINSNRFILDPDFQRDFVWKKFKQSKLIESCIMRLPLPVFYVAERNDGKLTIVDGLQRLSTFRDFLNNQFSLNFHSVDSKLGKHPLSGKKFEDLNIKLKERIEDTPLVIYVISSDAPIRALFDIFDRVNSGVPLSRQQMRNALFCGPATIWLKSIVKSTQFKNATNKSLNPEIMRDREAVNRFVSFKLIGRQNYKGDMDRFLAEGLVFLENEIKNNPEDLKTDFLSTMQLCHEIFGVHAFRKSMFKKNGKKSLLNMSLFDVMSVTFSNNHEKLSNINQLTIKENIVKLMNYDGFEESITKGTNSRKAVNCRYDAFENVVNNL